MCIRDSSNAVLTTSAHSISTDLVTEDFPASFALAANTEYWIVISRNATGTYGLYRETSRTQGTGVFVGSFQTNYELGIYLPLNTAADSSNESFSAATTSYSPTTTTAGSATDLSSKSYFGNMTGGSGLSAAFNGVSSQTYQTSASVNASTSTTGTVGVALGSPGFILTKVIIYGPSNTGINAPGGIKVYGNTSASASGGTLLHTAVAGSGDGEINQSTAGVSTLTINNTTSFENYYFEVLFSAGAAYVGEIELFSGTVNNMTLVSEAFTAQSAPSSAIIGVQTVETDSITINTDLTAEVSRNGGSNFTQCTLSLQSSLGATSTKYYESASTDISSQPSGTSIKYRIKTLNNKNVAVHGVALKLSLIHI